MPAWRNGEHNRPRFIKLPLCLWSLSHSHYNYVYAAGDPVGAMPPFTLSCQVRIRCVHIFGEWALVVHFNRRGAALHISHIKALLVLPGLWSTLDLLSHFGRLLSLFIVLQEFTDQKDCPLALHLVACSSHVLHLLNQPFILCWNGGSDSSSWQIIYFCIPPPPPPSRKDVSFTLTQCSLSLMDHCPPIITLNVHSHVCLYWIVFL